MTGLYYLTTTLSAVLLFGVGFVILKKAPNKLSLTLKIASVFLGLLLFVRLCLDTDNISLIHALKVGGGFDSKSAIVFALVQVWLMYAAELLLSLYPFFKIKALSNLVSIFALAVFVMNFAFMGNHILAIDGEKALSAVTLRGVMISVETAIGLSYSVLVLIKSLKNFKLSAREWGYTALGAAGMIACNAPSYTAQVLLNLKNYTIVATDLNFEHRLYLYAAVMIPIALYLLLRNRELAVKKFTLLYYALSILFIFSFSHKFANLQNLSNWPLHLCHTALYVTPICLIFNRKKLFYFTYFINVFGALIALTIPNFGSATVLSASVNSFFREHYQAFFMPLLIVGLKIFERPRLKQFKYSMIGFAVYFVCILLVNAIFSNFDPGVDYFFLNGDFVVEQLGNWAKNLRNIVWIIDVGTVQIKLYPVYQSVFFAVYFVIALAMWFIYELSYEIISGWADITSRNKKIKVDGLALRAKLGGRSIEEPLSMENINKLVLKNFTKRYGRSDVYAVKDACLEVNGGEIFGFLGPNGAGKSTIIKSVVGIQTITEGAIEVCGYDVATQSDRAKLQIGFVPDHYALYERLTAREYINYIADLYDVSMADRNERLDRYIKLFQFETAIDNPIKTYSHGMKQKVTIMSALIHNPKVWILDEPLTGLDPNSIYQVKECMKQHAKEGNIVFFSSHIIDVVERICDKIAIINKGQIQCVRDVKVLEQSGVVLENFYMEIINGNEVDAIAVKDGAKQVEVSSVKDGKRAVKKGRREK